MSPLPKVFIGSIAAFSIAHTVAAGVQYAGVNIAGFDFGCTPDVCPASTQAHIGSDKELGHMQCG